MSVNDALLLIQRIRVGDINFTIEDRQTETINDLIEIGRKHGLNFTEAELRIAFKQDWAERWMKLKG
jgi:hypothetical protein